MMIAINEPFKVGDVVDAAGHTGSIVEVNMMATVMKTADGKRIVIPNKSVWGGPIVNYNTLGLRRVDLQVGIDYGEDRRRRVAQRQRRADQRPPMGEERRLLACCGGYAQRSQVCT